MDPTCWYCGVSGKGLCKTAKDANGCPDYNGSTAARDADPFIPQAFVVPDKVKSDGSSTDYYKIPDGATDLIDLIEHKEMDFAIGNIFKACYRLGEKHGVDMLYDLNKIEYFVKRKKAALSSKS